MFGSTCFEVFRKVEGTGAAELEKLCLRGGSGGGTDERVGEREGDEVRDEEAGRVGEIGGCGKDPGARGRRGRFAGQGTSTPD